MKFTVKFGCISCLYVLINVLIHTSEAYNYDYMQENCSPTGVHINLTASTHSYGYVKLVKSGGYNPNLNCVMYIWAPAGHRLIIRFRKIEIFQPEASCTDTLYMSGNKSTHIFCGYGTPNYAYVSTADMLKLRFISQSHDEMDGVNDRIGFDLYYTSFHDGECDTSEMGKEFECRRDGRCIPRELTCDGRDNCGDWSDERSSVCGLPVGSIVMITLICALIGGTCIAACVYYVIDTKKVNRRPRNSPRSNHVEPAYTIGFSRGGPPGTVPVPPPYSQAPPDYTQYYNKDDIKVAQPPAYDNLSYETEVNRTSTNETVNENQQTADITSNSNTGSQPNGEQNTDSQVQQPETNVYETLQ